MQDSIQAHVQEKIAQLGTSHWWSGAPPSLVSCWESLLFLLNSWSPFLSLPSYWALKSWCPRFDADVAKSAWMAAHRRSPWSALPVPRSHVDAWQPAAPPRQNLSWAERTQTKAVAPWVQRRDGSGAWSNTIASLAVVSNRDSFHTGPLRPSRPVHDWLSRRDWHSTTRHMEWGREDLLVHLHLGTLHYVLDLVLFLYILI
jgi:hypothetical protein